MWVTGWYAGWLQNRMPANTIDYSVVTHVVHFMIDPLPDGSLGVSNRPGFGSNAEIAGTVNAVHAGGAKVLVTVGGAGSYTAFQSAIAPANRPKFVTNLVAFVARHNYDGVDVDMEPVNPADYADFRAFVTAMRLALPVGKLLTVAGASGVAVGPVAQHFDQINVMTYDMSGAFPGWVSWHNSPIDNGGGKFSNGREYPSAKTYLKEYTDAGVPSSKLALGIDFYGYVWTGVTQPREGWSQAPQVQANVPYYDLIRSYDLGRTRWDDAALAAYVSTPTQFVSLDDERTVQAKVDFARAHDLGGVCIWELCGGRLNDGTDPLLVAMKRALNQRRIIGKTGGEPIYLNLDTGAVEAPESRIVTVQRGQGSALTRDGRTAALSFSARGR